MAHATHCVPQLELQQKNRLHRLQTAWTGITQAIQQNWQEFTHPLELRVWQKTDRWGVTYWYGYDPRTGRSFASGSEADMRQWIEQRHRI